MHILRCKEKYYIERPTDASIKTKNTAISGRIQPRIPCAVLLKRINYIEDAVRKGCRSILLNQGKNGRETRAIE